MYVSSGTPKKGVHRLPPSQRGVSQPPRVVGKVEARLQSFCKVHGWCFGSRRSRWLATWTMPRKRSCSSRRAIHFLKQNMSFALLGKNFIPDQFSFQALAVKEGRRRKKSQREEHSGRERKRKEIGHVTKVNTEHLVTSRTTCKA